MSGPLESVRVVELAGIGPGPYTCMLLADAGADVIRIDRATGSPPATAAEPHWDLLNRSRPSVAVDLKHPEGVRLVLDLVEQADGLVEGWRPGVAERLGIGPAQCMERNPRLVYGRMTGWGQDGPLATAAGHDINYIALAGALWPIGRVGERPVPPLNLVGDFGGGGMLLAFGMCAALLEARASGRGQVVDAAMVDGAASLMTMTFAFRRLGLWTEGRGVNVLDTGAPFYEVYDTADGKWFSVGAIEPQFYAELLKVLGLDAEPLPAQNDREQWPAMKERFAAVFRTRTPRRMGRGLRRDRRLWRTGFVPLGGAHPPPQRAPRHIRRSRGRRAAGPRAQLQPDAGRRPQATVGRGSRRARGPAVLGDRRGSDRGPARRGRGGLSRWTEASAAPRDRRVQRFTTGQVTVRVMPSMSWMWLTTMRPRSSTDPAWVRTMTS